MKEYNYVCYDFYTISSQHYDLIAPTDDEIGSELPSRFSPGQYCTTSWHQRSFFSHMYTFTLTEVSSSAN